MSTDLTTAAAIIGVAKPVVETGCTLIKNLLGEPCKVAGNMLADQIYVWQWTNRIRIASRAQELLAEDGVAAEVLPSGFLIPLLEACGNTDDGSLQEMWARLLASSVANEDFRHPAFVRILRELSHDEARVLNAPSPRRFLMDEGATEVVPRPDWVDQSGLPSGDQMIQAQSGFRFWVNVPLCISSLKESLSEGDVLLQSTISAENLAMTLAHLESLGLVDIDRNAPHPVKEHVLVVTNTELGDRFIQACCSECCQ